MADLKKPTLRIVDIDENYQAPADAKPEELQKAAYAKAMREGAKRATVKHVAEVAGIKSAHVDELNRSGKIVEKASYHQAWTHASLLWLVIAAACLFTGAWLQTSGFAMRIADERIPRSAVPVLQYQEAPTSYPRDNPREPGDR